jgi:hypothetical protein
MGQRINTESRCNVEDDSVTTWGQNAMLWNRSYFNDIVIVSQEAIPIVDSSKSHDDPNRRT